MTGRVQEKNEWPPLRMRLRARVVPRGSHEVQLIGRCANMAQGQLERTRDQHRTTAGAKHWQARCSARTIGNNARESQ